MQELNGVTLKFRNQKRANYMSLFDMVKDLTTENLIELVKVQKMLKDQMTIMTELEIRNELPEDEYMELLESCNGF